MRERDRFASGACIRSKTGFASAPRRRDTRRTTRLLMSQKGGGSGDTSVMSETCFLHGRVRGHVGDMHSACGPLAQRRLTNRRQFNIVLAIAATVLLVLCMPAHAAGSGMPWEAPLQRILESIEGPVAKVSAVVIIIMTGLSLAFGDMGGGLRRLIQIVFGLSIAFAATSFFLSFFSFAGGALIN